MCYILYRSLVITLLIAKYGKYIMENETNSNHTPQTAEQIAQAQGAYLIRKLERLEQEKIDLLLKNQALSQERDLLRKRVEPKQKEAQMSPQVSKNSSQGISEQRNESVKIDLSDRTPGVPNSGTLPSITLNRREKLLVPKF